MKKITVFSFLSLLTCSMASFGMEFDYLDLNEDPMAKQKEETKQWILSKIDKINPGYKTVKSRRTNCTPVSEECAKVLAGFKEPEKVPAIHEDIDTICKTNEAGELVSFEVLREEQTAFVKQQEFMESIDLIQGTVSVDMTSEDAPIIKYLTSNRKTIIDDIKNIAKASDGDKTLTGLIYYQSKTKKIGTIEGHSANFFRDRYGNVFFVDAQNQTVTEEPPTKIMTRDLTDSIFFFPLQPKQGFLIKKEIPDVSIIKKEPDESTPKETKTAKQTKSKKKKRIEFTENDQNFLEQLHRSEDKTDAYLLFSLLGQQQKNESSKKQRPSEEYNISPIFADEIQEIGPRSTSSETAAALKNGTIKPSTTDLMRDDIKKFVQQEDYLAYKDNSRPLQYIYRQNHSSHPILYVCTLCDHIAFDKIRAIKDHMKDQHQKNIDEIQGTHLQYVIETLIPTVSSESSNSIETTPQQQSTENDPQQIVNDRLDVISARNPITHKNVQEYSQQVGFSDLAQQQQGQNKRKSPQDIEQENKRKKLNEEFTQKQLIVAQDLIRKCIVVPGRGNHTMSIQYRCPLCIGNNLYLTESGLIKHVKELHKKMVVDERYVKEMHDNLQKQAILTEMNTLITATNLKLTEFRQKKIITIQELLQKNIVRTDNVNVRNEYKCPLCDYSVREHALLQHIREFAHHMQEKHGKLIIEENHSNSLKEEFEKKDVIAYSDLQRDNTIFYDYNHFSKCVGFNDIRICPICKDIFRSSNLSSNLINHLQEKHQKVISYPWDNKSKTNQQESTSQVMPDFKEKIIFQNIQTSLMKPAEANKEEFNMTGQKLEKAEISQKPLEFKCAICKTTYFSKPYFENHIKKHNTVG